MLHCFFVINNFIFQFLHYYFILLIKVCTITLSVTAQMVARSSIVWTTWVQTLFLITMSILRKSLHLLIFFFILIQKWGESRWLLNIKGWKFNNILQHWSFTNCQNSMEDIKLEWKACSILDDTHYKSNRNKKLCNTINT
jgi:hypothetical protein